MAQHLTPQQFQDRLQRSGITLLDVRLEEDFEAAHLPGAMGNCVFEVQFLEKFREQNPATARPVVVYGWSDSSLEAVDAAEKLEQAGYLDVAILTGGLAGWRAAGFPVESGKAAPHAPQISDGIHAVDAGASRVEWTGRNLLNEHRGTIAVARGELVFRNQEPVSGWLTLDLTRLSCQDLEGDPLHQVLIDHLQSSDFLDTVRHPEARLDLTHLRKVPGAAAGVPNLEVGGALTLRGLARPVRCCLTGGITPEGKAAAQGTLLLDRTRWGILYGSGSWYQKLGGHLVNHEVVLSVRVVTR